MTKDNLTKEQLSKLFQTPYYAGRWSGGPTGTWRQPDRATTGDVERDKLLEMSMTDFEAILQEPEHELYDKATDVATEIAKRIAFSIRPWGVVHPEVRKKFFDFLSIPSFAAWYLHQGDESQGKFGRMFELLMPGLLAEKYTSSLNETSDGDKATGSDASDPVDVAAGLNLFDDFEDFVVPGPDESVLTHIRGWEDFAHRLDALYMSQEQARLDAIQASSEARMQAEVAKRTANRSLWVSIGASVVAIVSVITTIGMG